LARGTVERVWFKRLMGDDFASLGAIFR
jgi:hypothetical protein